MKKMVIFSSIVEKKGVIYQLVVWGQEKIWVPRKTFLCFTFVIDVWCLYDLIRRSEFDLSRRTNFRPILAKYPAVHEGRNIGGCVTLFFLPAKLHFNKG